MQQPTDKTPTSSTAPTTTSTTTTSHHGIKRKYNATSAKTAVSGATLGSICAYVQRYGTPYQCSKVVILVHKLLELQKEAYIQEKQKQNGCASVDTIPWSKLKHELYELTGPFLWRHAVHHWKTCIAPQMKIPVALQEEVLKLDEYEEEEDKDDGKQEKKKKRALDEKEGISDKDKNIQKNQNDKKTKDSKGKSFDGKNKEKGMFASTAGIWSGWSLDLTSPQSTNKLNTSNVEEEAKERNKTANAASAADSVMGAAAAASEAKRESMTSVETTTQTSSTAAAMNANTSTKNDVKSVPTTTKAETVTKDPTKAQEKHMDSSLMPPPQNVPKPTTSGASLPPSSSSSAPSPPRATAVDPSSQQTEGKGTTTSQSVLLPDNQKKGFLNFAEYDFGNSATAANAATAAPGATKVSKKPPQKEEKEEHHEDEKENEQGYEQYFQDNWNTTISEKQNDKDTKKKVDGGNEPPKVDSVKDTTTTTRTPESPNGHNTRKRKRVDYAALAQTEYGDDEDDYNDEKNIHSQSKNKDAPYAAITAATASHVRKRHGHESTSAYVGVYKRRGSSRGDKDDHTNESITGTGEDDEHDTDEKHHHHHGKHWTAQCLMRYSTETKHKKSSNFHIGTYDTENEAAFAVDVMQMFFNPEMAQKGATAPTPQDGNALTTPSKAGEEAQALNNENDGNKSEGIRNRRKFKLNISTIEQCESIWEPHLKEYGWLRTVDVIDVKLRPALRKIVHAAVMEWSASGGGDSGEKQLALEDNKIGVANDDSDGNKRNIVAKAEVKKGDDAVDVAATDKDDCEKEQIDGDKRKIDKTKQPSSKEIDGNSGTTNAMDLGGDKDDLIVINDNSTRSDDVKMINPDDDEDDVKKDTSSDVGDGDAVLIDDDNDGTMDDGGSSSSVAVVEENNFRDSPSSANNDSGSGGDGDEVQNIDVIDLS